jgi:hypothetical protein
MSFRSIKRRAGPTVASRKWTPRSLREVALFEPKIYEYLQDVASQEGVDAYIQEWERIFGPMPDFMLRRLNGETHVIPMPEPAWERNLNEAWAWVVRLFRRPMEVPPRPPASESKSGSESTQGG